VVFNELLEMRSCRDSAATRGSGLTGTDLPVVDLQTPYRTGGIEHEHALRAQGAMHELLLVGVLDRLGQVTQQRETVLDAQSRPVLMEKVVEPQCVRVMFEDQCGTELLILVVDSAQNGRVIDSFENLELALGRTHDHLPRLRGGTTRNLINAYASRHVRH